MISQIPVSKFVESIKAINIPRAEDLPYWQSPPIQFVYESTANLALGAYTWADVPTAFTPQRPILINALYYFRNISLVADTAEFDFSSNIVTTPNFYTFLESYSDAVLFREPVQMNKFYDQFTFRFFWQSYRSDDIIKGAFRGSLIQGPGLVGKNAVTLKAIISAQEIVDEHYIQLFKSNYPKPPENVRAEDYGE